MEKLYHQYPTATCATPAPSRSQPASSAESFRRGSWPPHFSRTYFAKMRTLRESPYTSQRGTHRVSSSRFSLCQVLQRLLSRLIACRFLDALLPNAVVFFGEIVPPLSDLNLCHNGVLTLPTSQRGPIFLPRQLAAVFRYDAYAVLRVRSDTWCVHMAEDGNRTAYDGGCRGRDAVPCVPRVQRTSILTRGALPAR